VQHAIRPRILRRHGGCGVGRGARRALGGGGHGALRQRAEQQHVVQAEVRLQPLQLLLVAGRLELFCVFVFLCFLCLLFVFFVTSCCVFCDIFLNFPSLVIFFFLLVVANNSTSS